MKRKMPGEQLLVELGYAESWCSGLETPFFLAENKSGNKCDEVQKLLSQTASLSGTTWEALIWLRVGLIARAHELVQDAGTGVEAYIHGMIHRLEGDYWNAKYWFRTAGRKTIEIIGEQFQERDSNNAFSPNLFVDRLEQFHASSRSSNRFQEIATTEVELALRSMLENEWWSVWKVCNP